MSVNPELEKALQEHPCYSEAAHTAYARMHIPVAPKCNIQCNFCNRKFDCSNESRPGVTSEVLTPEQAAAKIAYVREHVPNLKVIGIAGPGDPLANEETFETLALVKERFPDLTLCISTNGLALPDSAERLYGLGVRFVTVTVNAPDEETGAEVYGSVIWEGRRLTGREGARILLSRQMEGIEKCAALGMLVKVNIVMIPGKNADRIPEIVKIAKAKGAYIVNILPFIPVKGTAFENLRPPTAEERKALMDLCSADARMMRHCRQCRADAVGLLGEDRSAEFAGCGYGSGNGCGPAETGPNMVSFRTGKYVIALASENGRNVDSGFGSASRFLVYSADGPDIRFLREVRPADLAKEVAGRSHKEHVEEIVTLLDDCDIIAVKEIGDMPRAVIEGRGKRVIVTDGGVRETVSSIR